MVDALISVRKQVETEKNNAYDEDVIDLDPLEFDPDEYDNIAIPLATSSSATATSTSSSATATSVVMSDTSITVHVESSAVSSSSSSSESFVQIPTRFTKEETQLLLKCTIDADFLTKATTRVTKGIKVVRKPRIKWPKIEALFKAKKNNTTIFERTKNRLENYCKESRKRQREYDAELQENQISNIETEIIEVAVSANQELENHNNEGTNREVDNNNAIPLIPITPASRVQEDDKRGHQIDRTNDEVNNINGISLVLNSNSENVVQVRIANIASTTSERIMRVGDLTKPESDFVRDVGKELMTKNKMVMASDLLLAYNSRHPGYTRDGSQLRKSWMNFKDSNAYKTFRDSIKR